MDMKQLIGVGILTMVAVSLFGLMVDVMGWRGALLGLIVVIAATAVIILGIALVTGII